MANKPTIKELQKAAMTDKWDFVDKSIPVVVQDGRYISWASRFGITSVFGPLRDLGASILEKAQVPEDKFSLIRPSLERMMVKNSSTYDGFRAACALAAHDPRDYREEVIQVLKRFKGDEGVKGIAKEYLRKLGAS